MRSLAPKQAKHSNCYLWLKHKAAGQTPYVLQDQLVMQGLSSVFGFKK